MNFLFLLGVSGVGDYFHALFSAIGYGLGVLVGMIVIATAFVYLSGAFKRPEPKVVHHHHHEEAAIVKAEPAAIVPAPAAEENLPAPVEEPTGTNPEVTDQPNTEKTE